MGARRTLITIRTVRNLADQSSRAGEALEAVATAKRDEVPALKLLKRIMKKYGAPRSIVTDGLRAYSAAMNAIAVAADRREVGGRLNNRAENSHQPFRRRERAMQRFRSPKTLQKFSSVHAQAHNQFDQERHLVMRQVYEQRRSAAFGRVARSRGIDRRSRGGGRAARRRACVTLTPPGRGAPLIGVRAMGNDFLGGNTAHQHARAKCGY
jgi:hypothetical protein